MGKKSGRIIDFQMIFLYFYKEKSRGGLNFIKKRIQQNREGMPSEANKSVLFKLLYCFYFFNNEPKNKRTEGKKRRRRGFGEKRARYFLVAYEGDTQPRRREKGRQQSRYQTSTNTHVRHIFCYFFTLRCFFFFIQPFHRVTLQPYYV